MKRRLHVRLLEWVCASRWRTLLAWVALSIAPLGILASRFGLYSYDSLLDGLGSLTARLTLALPAADLAAAGWVSLIMFASTWFQPLLLRLGSGRTLAWIVVFTSLPIVAAVAHPRGLNGLVGIDFPGVVATTAACTSLLLIGRRTRPWAGVIAGGAYELSLRAACSEGIPLLPDSGRDGSLPYLIPVHFINGLGGAQIEVVNAVLPGLVVIMVGNMAFGVPLIFGTRSLGQGGPEHSSTHPDSGTEAVS